MKQFGEVLLVPVVDDIEMGRAGDGAVIDESSAGEYFEFAQLELESFDHDGVVAVVEEEQNVLVAVAEAVALVGDALVLLIHYSDQLKNRLH